MLTFQDLILQLTDFWKKKGCLIQQGYDLEVGAGTFNPATFLRCLGPEPYSVAYLEPSRRPKDGRYAENPNRMQLFHQFQVILKPCPLDIQDMYLQSLEALGFNLHEHDIRFVHDDWESPTLGASGLGWEVWINGMEMTQFTYFQTIGGMSLETISGEITYGVERLCMYLQKKENVFDLQWNETLTYGDVCFNSERQWSYYNFDFANTSMWHQHFIDFEKETHVLIERNLPIPAYDFVLKASHAFNLLDARGVISVTERTGYINRIRALACLVAKNYYALRAELGFPLLKKDSYPLFSSPHSTTSTDCLASLSNIDFSKKEDFIFEIGSEELPSAFMEGALAQLEKKFKGFLKDKNLSYEKLEVFGTPRRLAVYITQLGYGVIGKEEKKRGPKVTDAFDEHGFVTEVGAGFLKSFGRNVKTLTELKKDPDISIENTKDFDHIYILTKQKPLSTQELLKTFLPKLITDFEFPKKMRWCSSHLTYARPIRWIVALHGSAIVSFSIDYLFSHNTTFGHKQLANQAIDIPKAQDYLSLLEKHWVIADVNKRKSMIEHDLVTICEKQGLSIIQQSKVMREVVHLVEWPFVILAHFDSKYLEAPEEVIISEMIDHQKYFPTKNENGLTPSFFIIANNTPSSTIIEGNLKAITPRLADGLFLYKTDLQKPLDSFNEKLRTITFQQSLGSMWDKVKRLEFICAWLHQHIKTSDNAPLGSFPLIQRACFLCKSDLASTLVQEFPELQGVIGKEYAYAQNEIAEVCTAIEEHWLMSNPKEKLPHTPTGIILGLADAIDNLTSCFAVDLKPSSSNDPYALRRQAINLITLIIEKKLYFAIDEIVAHLLDQLKNVFHLTIDSSIVLQELLAFIQARMKTVFLQYAFSKDEIEAATSFPLSDIANTYDKVFSLHELRKMHYTSFESLIQVYKRAKGILKKDAPSVVDPQYFEPIEHKLYDMVQKTNKVLKEATINKKYASAYCALIDLSSVLALFFDQVQVMSNDLKLQKNRQALLSQVTNLFAQMIDFEKLQLF